MLEKSIRMFCFGFVNSTDCGCCCGAQRAPDNQIPPCVSFHFSDNILCALSFAALGFQKPVTVTQSKHHRNSMFTELRKPTL